MYKILTDQNKLLGYAAQPNYIKVTPGGYVPCVPVEAVGLNRFTVPMPACTLWRPPSRSSNPNSSVATPRAKATSVKEASLPTPASSPAAPNSRAPSSRPMHRGFRNRFTPSPRIPGQHC